MRELTNGKKLSEFMEIFGRSARSDCRIYFTGGATAVLMGWRDSTIDVDLRFEPELDELFRALPEIKEQLQINVELASPSDFIPPLPGWHERSPYIGKSGKAHFFHYDPYSQALSKIERGHDQDLQDVESMFRSGLLDQQKLLSLFDDIKPHLYRYPAINPEIFERALHNVLKQRSQ